MRLCFFLLLAACVTQQPAITPGGLPVEVSTSAQQVTLGELVTLTVTPSRSARYWIVKDGAVMARGEAASDAPATLTLAAAELAFGDNTFTVVARDARGAARTDIKVARLADPVIAPTGATGATCMAGFEGSTFNSAEIDANGQAVITGGATSGTVTSAIFDGGVTRSWNELRWVPQRPYGKELPTGTSVEGAYPAGNASMANALVSLRFEETSGDTFANSAAQALPATCVTCPVLNVPGDIGRAARFDGATTSAVMDISAGQVEPAVVTGEAWVNVTSLPGAGSNGAVFGKGIGNNTFDDPFSTWALELIDDGRFKSYMGFDMHSNAWGLTGSTVYGVDSVSPPSGFVHVAFTYDQTNQAIYFNGDLERTQVPPGPNMSTTFEYGTSVTRDLIIGRYNTFQYFNGDIDEINVWGRVLSATELRDHYLRHAQRASFQVRACDDPNCAGEEFVGPSGSISTSYSERDNDTLGLPALTLYNVTGRYIQFRLTLGARGVGTPSPLVSGVTLCSPAPPP